MRLVGFSLSSRTKNSIVLVLVQMKGREGGKYRLLNGNLFNFTLLDLVQLFLLTGRKSQNRGQQILCIFCSHFTFHFGFIIIISISSTPRVRVVTFVRKLLCKIK